MAWDDQSGAYGAGPTNTDIKVDEMTVIKEGLLNKKGLGPLAGWKNRWIVLYANKTIEYWVEDKKELKGTIDISPNNLKKDIAQNSVKAMDKVDNGFKILCNTRTWEFKCESLSSRDNWINAIRSSITGDYIKQKKEELLAAQAKKQAISNSYNNNNNNNMSQAERDRQQRRQQRQNRKQNRTMKDRLAEENPGYEYASQQQQEQIEQIQNRTDDALDNALRITNEIEETAFDTAYKLDNQRNQLIKIDQDLHDMDQTLDQTDKTLKGMKSIGGALKQKLFGKKIEKQEYQAPVGKDSAFVRDSNGGNSGNNNRGGGGMYDDNQTETDEKLDQVLQSVKRIHHVTDDINTELTEQDQIIDNINDKMDRVDYKMKKQTNTMKKIR